MTYLEHNVKNILLDVMLYINIYQFISLIMNFILFIQVIIVMELIF